MARPLKDGLTYFQHDVSMSADEKLEALEAVHGNDGYAVYNKLLERIYKSFGKIDLSDDVQRLSIARKCNVTAEKFEAIIADAVRFRLFDKESWEKKKSLTSERIRAQLETVEEEREKWRKKSGGENPAQSELSPGITPIIPGDNLGYPSGKVHKAEERRGEKYKSSSCAREDQPVDNSPPRNPTEEANLFAFALARVSTRKKRPDNPEGMARRIMLEPDVLAAWRESLANPPPPPDPVLPPPPPCPECGGELVRWPTDPANQRTCTRCRLTLVFNDFAEDWERVEIPEGVLSG